MHVHLRSSNSGANKLSDSLSSNNLVQPVRLQPHVFAATCCHRHLTVLAVSHGGLASRLHPKSPLHLGRLQLLVLYYMPKENKQATPQKTNKQADTNIKIKPNSLAGPSPRLPVDLAGPSLTNCTFHFLSDMLGTSRWGPVFKREIEKIIVDVYGNWEK